MNRMHWERFRKYNDNDLLLEPYHVEINKPEELISG